ncbi:MAG: hypothetical protein NC397_01220 [Clostridium sp.]|nr:hypothetical protein [Clostridium sp.]
MNYSVKIYRKDCGIKDTILEYELNERESVSIEELISEDGGNIKALKMLAIECYDALFQCEGKITELYNGIIKVKNISDVIKKESV